MTYFISNKKIFLTSEKTFFEAHSIFNCVWNYVKLSFAGNWLTMSRKFLGIISNELTRRIIVNLIYYFACRVRVGFLPHSHSCTRKHQHTRALPRPQLQAHARAECASLPTAPQKLWNLIERLLNALLFDTLSVCLKF